MPTLGKFIQRRRAELGLTQEQLAELVGGGVRQAEISRLEHDRVTLPRRQRLEQIARALDVPLGELLVRSGWVGAEAIDGENPAMDDQIEHLQARNEQLESTVNVLATTNVDLRSQVVKLESEARRTGQQQEFLRTVLDGIADPVAAVDASGDIVAENAAFTSLRESHGGLNRISTLSGEPIAGALGAFRPTDSDEELTTTIVVTDEDSRSWHEVHVQPTTLDDGTQINVVTVRECAEPD